MHELKWTTTHTFITIDIVSPLIPNVSICAHLRPFAPIFSQSRLRIPSGADWRVFCWRIGFAYPLRLLALQSPVARVLEVPQRGGSVCGHVRMPLETPRIKSRTNVFV